MMDATHEIVRIEPGRLLETRVTSEGTVMQSLVQVEPVRDDACVIIVQSTIEWGGSFMALTSRVMTALAGRATFSAYLEQLRDAIEAEARRELLTRLTPAPRVPSPRGTATAEPGRRRG